MVLDLSIVQMEMIEMGVCPALRRTSGGTYIAMGTEVLSFFPEVWLIESCARTPLEGLMLTVSSVIVSLLKTKGSLTTLRFPCYQV